MPSSIPSAFRCFIRLSHELGELRDFFLTDQDLEYANYIESAQNLSRQRRSERTALAM